MASAIDSFSVVANPAALAVTISWSVPTNVAFFDLMDLSGLSAAESLYTTIRLVRRVLGYSVDQDDGTILYEGSPAKGRYTDTDVQNGVVYYYTMFSLSVEDGWVSEPTTRADAIPVKTGFFSQKLFDLLDEAYALGDQKLDQGVATQQILSLVTSDETGYVYNQDESEGREKGPLERFLKIFGAELDYAKGLIDALPGQQDIDSIRVEYLQDFVAIIGAEVNTDLPPNLMREDVKRTVSSYKVRGTIIGMIAKVRAISGLTATVDEDLNHILCSNQAGRTSADVSAQEGAFKDLENDLLFYSSDDAECSWLTFTVFIQLGVTQGLDIPVVQRLCQAIPDFTPLGRIPRVRFIVGGRSSTLAIITGDALSGGFSRGRDELTPFSDNLVEQPIVADITTWMFTNFQDSGATNQTTNNPFVFTGI